MGKTISAEKIKAILCELILEIKNTKSKTQEQFLVSRDFFISDFF